ncbi:MAG: hypothetical protein E7046_08910 [Lentisphaerae bacterium]|nr:hypothetical protein [Lentisphaerota bacterium]
MKRIISSIVVCMAIFVFTAFAEDAYTPTDIAWLVKKSGDSKGTNPTALPGAGCWQIDGANAPLETDVVREQAYGYSETRYKGGDAYKLRMPQSIETFVGKSFSVGDLNVADTKENSSQIIFRTGTAGSVDELTFANHGLILNRGSMYCAQDGSLILHGKVTVNSPAETPFSVYFYKNRSELKFTGLVSSGIENGLYIHSLPSAQYPGDSSQTNFICRFAEGSLSSFYGSLICGPVAWVDKDDKSDYYKSNSTYRKPPYYATISSGTSEMPGKLILYPGANLAAESSSTIFSVAKLQSVHDWGTNTLVVTMADDAKSCSLVRVTESLSLVSPLRIRLAGLEKFSADVATNAASRLAVFKAPADVTLNEADFILERTELNPYVPYLPDYRIEISNDTDGLSTVWIVARPVVWSLSGDDKQYNSLFNESRKQYWSNNGILSSANDYLMSPGHQIRTPAKSVSEPIQVFGGNSLSMSSNTMFTACAHTTRIEDFRIFSYCRLTGLANGNPSNDLIDGPVGSWKLQGKLWLDGSESNEKDTLHIQNYQSAMWIVESEISGRGRIYVDNASQSGNSNAKLAWTAILGLNTNFYGKILVKNADASFANKIGTHLLISDARNLGGTMPQWTYDALNLGNCSALHPLADLTLEDSTRGIFVSSDRAFFTVKKDVVFTCKERITYKGVLIKDGPGELALGGPQPYFDGDGDTGPTAGKNVLDLYEGTLRPVSATAFTGINLTITNGATLVFSVPASNDDGDIGQYGILNKNVNTPMTIPASGYAVKIEDPNKVLERQSSARVPICTVKASAKTDLEGKLTVRRTPSLVGAEWIENEDGSWTYVAEVARRGMIIRIR